jgi:hypothetical protein
LDLFLELGEVALDRQRLCSSGACELAQQPLLQGCLTGSKTQVSRHQHRTDGDHQDHD